MAESPVAIDFAKYQRDEDYFFESECFAVNNILFRVPRHLFEESEAFREMFDLSGSSIGTGVHRIHILTGLTPDEFRQLLRVLYPRRFGREYLTHSQWVAVLKLSTRWKMKGPRQLAIKGVEREDMDAFQYLSLAQEFSVKRWWYRALACFAERPSLTEEEKNRLGPELSVKVISLQCYVAGYRHRGDMKALENGLTLNDQKAGIHSDVLMFIRKLFPELEMLEEEDSIDVTVSRPTPKGRALYYGYLVSFFFLAVVVSFLDAFEN